MADLIDRYVYDVTRRLPEKDREDVKQELSANIYDMLPQDAGQEEIEAVLQELGAPAVMAEQYRTKPRYLISPALYDDYIRTLKWVLPLVGVLLLALGLVLGGIEAASGEQEPVAAVASFISGGLSRGISMGVSGAVQALVWVTAGFAIADHAGYKASQSGEPWKVQDLPEEVPGDKYNISLADSIVELALTVVFGVLVILWCLGLLPFAFAISASGGGIQVTRLFSDSFRAVCLPVIAISMLFGVAECVVKIIFRRWKPLVCGAVIASNLVNIGAMLFLFTRPGIFSPEFSLFVESQRWGGFDLLRFWGNGLGNPVLVLISAIVVVAGLVECILAVYRTMKASAVA